MRPRTRRRRRRAVWLLAALAGLLLFLVGVAVGEALRDNPRPGRTTTAVTTVTP